MSNNFDVIIVGAGPGGYVAAIRGAQLGLKIAIIDKAEVGGVCLNWGCIPSKNLIHQAEVFSSLTEMEGVGVKVDRRAFNYASVQEKSRAVVSTLTNGVKGLLKKNKITLIQGKATLCKKDTVSVEHEGTTSEYNAKNIMLATGSRPTQVAGFEFDEKQILSSTGILSLTTLPKSLVILGAGAIGCEFAYVMNAFGVKVTLIEAQSHILPSEDGEVCALLHKDFLHQGIDIKLETRAIKTEKNDDSVNVTIQKADGTQEAIKAEKVLAVFGRKPNTESLGLDKVGVKLDARGFIEVYDYCQTNVAGVYAIGDITPSPALAHVASWEGELAIEHMAGMTRPEPKIDHDKVPSAIYCEPQVAGFGLREEDAEKQKLKINKSVFKYAGAGKTIAIGKTNGIVKILTDQSSGEILGAHIVGHNATELIHQLLQAKSAELLAEDLMEVVFAHPTISEAILEATRGLKNQAIHA